MDVEVASLSKHPTFRVIGRFSCPCATWDMSGRRIVQFRL